MTATIDTVVLPREARRPGDAPRRSAAPRRPRPATPRERAPRPVPGPRPTPSRRARTGVFAVFMLVILAVGLVGMLLVNTALAQGAFVLSDLQRQQVELTESEQRLREQVALASAPGQLEMAARALGMVPQDVPAFLRLSDGAVLGNAIPQPAPIVEEPAPAPVSGELPATGDLPAPVDPPATGDLPAPVDAPATGEAVAPDPAEGTTTEAPVEVLP